ncbi:MAG: universal stress protein [Bryobacteraceae bacterium]|nr:universal stress protein [Bryobacteraceae bacterium]
MPERFRLLVAYDGSPCADDMIEDLRNAGIPASAHVLVVSVAERWLPPPSVYEVATAPSAARGKDHAVRWARMGASRMSARHPDWVIEHEGHTGSPARVILHRAKEWNAQLVALGSLGHNAVERIFIGSVSQKVANEAQCSVRVSRGKSPSGGLKLLLAYDGRPGSEAAAAKIATRTWPAGTEVLVVAATGFNGPPLGECDVPSDREVLERLLDPVCQMLTEAGLHVRTSIQEADPKNLIVEEATRWECHCIFAGCNDHSLVERLLLGTVSAALISRAPCSVEVVR